MSLRKTRRLMTAMALAATALLSSGAAHAQLEGALFQPRGENLMLDTPSGWRLAYMNGDPDGDYIVEFMPANEAHDNWHEGYMAVQRRTFPESALMDNIKARHLTVAQVVISQATQSAQRVCPGRFTPMRQKDSLTNGIPTSVSGGYCDQAGAAAQYGEGSIVASFQGKERLFVVQFSWRPPTATAAKVSSWGITPARLQQFLDILNGAALCGGKDEPACPK